MPGHDIIVIGASAGGVDALRQLAAGLPPDLPAAVFVVVHLPAHGPSVLPKILSRAGPLPAVHPQDGQPIRPGTICVAPPDYHLLVERGRLALSTDEAVQFARPSIDVLFESVADAYGVQAIGIILTGANEDGAAGLARIKERGGVAIVQEPATSERRAMPDAALRAAAADAVLPLEDIGPFLYGLCCAASEVHA